MPLGVRVRVSAGPPYSFSQMPQLDDLKTATILKDVADLLGVKVAMLSHLLYFKPKLELYKKFEIEKKYGGIREINAPEKHLKLVQFRLSQLLQDCIEEINKSHGHTEDGKHFGIAHGFKRHHSFMTNAQRHVTRRYVFNVDLHDFFGSINFGRVRGFFIKDKNFALNPAVATVLAQIACYENKLPQGSPCSPVISNLIGHTMDILMVRLAKGSGCTYTRYADDLTFSTNKQLFPSRVAVEVGAKGDEWLPGVGLQRLVVKSGFSINDKKTRMQYRDSRQEVTGLTVNRKINVPATYRYLVRAMAHALFDTGSFEFIHRKNSPAGVEVVKSVPGRPKQLLGMFTHIDRIDLFNQKLCIENEIEPIETPGRTRLFRRFLYFNSFYSPSSPLVVCEGKTDNIYLKCAIRSLSGLYPSLIASPTAEKFNIQFWRYSERRTSRVTEITGGVGGLCKLIKHYHDDIINKFHAPPPKHPVIVLIDNDSGAHSVYGAIAGIAKKKKPKGTAPFIHVIGNLYVVPTPLTAAGGETMIEDFFDPAILKTTLNGKTFDPSKDMDDTKHYSKAAFARDVVAKNASSINFSNFQGILDRVDAVVKDYAVKYIALAAGAKLSTP